MASASSKKRGLGKGLGALIPDEPLYTPKPVEEAISTSAVAEIEIDKIETNPYQPRAMFDESSLQELAESIKQLGVIQPITVRKVGDDRYQLISGERRLRAAKMAGLKTIPAFVRSTDDSKMLLEALVENIQREDLNPIEIAISFKRLIEELNLTQEQLSKTTGKGRSTIANYLRLLNLPPEIQAGIRTEKITMAHAKAIAALPDKFSQIKVYYKVLAAGLSVKKTEELVREMLESSGKTQKKRKSEALPEHYKQWRDSLKQALQTKVELKLNKEGKGKLVINFTNKDQLEKIMQLLNIQANNDSSEQ